MKILVEQWWKKWSAQLSLALYFLAEFGPEWETLREHLPPDWFKYGFLAIFVARVLKQQLTAPK